MKNEKVAVLSSKSLYELCPNLNGFLSIRNINNNIINFLKTNQECGIRPYIENDFNFKQIIPYMIFKYNDSIFIYDRGNGGNEIRLHDQYSIGIGGHLQFNESKNLPIESWGEREFYEEVHYDGKFNCKLLGLLNDESTNVGKVHLGVVILIEGTSKNIKIKSEMKSGKLISIKECYEDYYSKLENWSKFCIEEILKY